MIECARRARSAGFLVAATAMTAILAGCAHGGGRVDFDSIEHLRERYEERLGPARASEVEVPYALDDELRAAAGERLGPAGRDQWKVEQILDFIFHRLDLEYALRPTHDAIETFHTRQGNCLSFVNLFVGLAREARLNPFYVEVKDYQRWNYQDGTVISNGHIVAGLRITGDLRTYDFLPYRPKSYRDFEPIDDLKATAHYYNNLGAEALLRGDVEEAYEHLEIASGLAPDFDKAWNNLGVALMRLGSVQEAVEIYRRALETSPEDVALLSNLARAHQQLGHQERADELMARLESVHSTHPFFFIYRGELALSRGETDEALRFMAKALRRDSEIPEVHVGLVKVYLAVGALDKARHHVGRALRLDATHTEAREYAAILERMDEPGR